MIAGKKSEGVAAGLVAEDDGGDAEGWGDDDLGLENCSKTAAVNKLPLHYPHHEIVRHSSNMSEESVEDMYQLTLKLKRI